MTIVEELAPAKVNLDLLVTGRRADGYHELDSLTAFAAFGDRLTLQDANQLELNVTGPFAAALADEPDNLVLRAVRLLAALAGREAVVRITLDKRIPVAAGLGGGSADAAATLHGLNRLWGLSLTPADLHRVGAELGADLPVCLAGRTVRMRGIGDRLEPWDGLPVLPALLVNPNLPLATGAVFGALEISPVEERAWPPPHAPAAFLSWLDRTSNHLEAPARRILPPIQDVLATIAAQSGCAVARMSGSGATCFGLFRSNAARDAAADTVGRQRPQWWQAATVIGARAP